MGASKGPKKRPANSNKGAPKPWEPASHHLEWYRKWVKESKGPSEIAREYQADTGKSITRQSVLIAIQKIDHWMRVETIDEVILYRNKLTRQYEMVQQIALEAFKASAGEIVTVTEVVGGEFPTTTTKTEYSQGQNAYLGTYLAAAKGIRELKGLDAPTKSEVTTRHAEEIEGLPLPQGHKSRAEALREAARAISDIADRSEGKTLSGMR